MRSTLSICLALAGTLAVLPPPAAAARSTITTPVMLPEAPLSAQPFQPDTAAPPESTTFLQFVQICPQQGCGRPICRYDSIMVELGGAFPNTCFTVTKVDFYYPPIVSIRPMPPWVRVIVDDNACLGQPCTPVRTPWSAAIPIPGVPEGSYALNVAVIRVSCTDSVPPFPWPHQSFGFSVAGCDTTPPPVGCLHDGWEHPNGSGTCDASVTLEQPAQVTFMLSTTTPLSGLQGTLDVRPFGLRVTNIEPIGIASSMSLSWSAHDIGADFVLFSHDSTTIPPARNLGWPLLRVTLAARPMIPQHLPRDEVIPPETRIYATSLLGSTPDGEAVRLCPRLETDPGSIFREVFARICAGPDCDINHDAITDVRDLVLMVHCIQSPTRCAAFDCNHDGGTNIDDVLCCAWTILRHAPCDSAGCDTVHARPEPGVHVVVGLPIEASGEIRVPIHVDGADRVGAARFAMRFPADRWRIVGLDASSSQWLTLAGDESGQVVMGAIRTSAASAPEGLDLTLRLEPRGSAPDGGELGTLHADVSGPDGVKLIVPVTAPARPLPGGAVIALSENRPDPFTGETRFTVSLPTEAAVDLAVFDLNGRRVASIVHGVLPAGVSEYAWSGRTDHGDRVRAGVYFYRLASGPRSVSRRMVFLGGN